MSENFKHKAVVFNLDDPMQLEEYEHSKKHKNFSSYIKKLIRRDLERNTRPAEPIKSAGGIKYVVK